MNKLFPLYLLITFLFPAQSFAQDAATTKKVLRLIADDIIHSTKFEFVDVSTDNRFKSIDVIPSDVKLKFQSPYTDWRYWNGVLNLALLELGSELKEPSYARFVEGNIEFALNNFRYFQQKYEGEGKWVYPFGQLFIMEELDDCGAMGASVIEIYKSDQYKSYWTYITKAANHILNKQDRLEDGTLVRSFPRKWTLWADDLYMSISFLARMGEMTSEEKYFDDAAKQVINFHKHLFDDKKELMYHCWYSDLKKNGVAFWGRANGWALLAQAELLDRLPPKHKDRNKLISLFKKHVAGISNYQSKVGLWHQLLDKSDSFLETSCSAMFTYAMARGINNGYLDKKYLSVAEKGWRGVFTKINNDNKIEGVCTGTGISDKIEFYYERPTPLHDAHGIGTVLLAGCEFLKLTLKK